MIRRNYRHQAKWNESVVAKLEDTIKKYSSTESFYKGDLIEHERFGRGRVQTSFGNKIEVIFQDKMRILIHRLLF